MTISKWIVFSCMCMETITALLLWYGTRYTLFFTMFYFGLVYVLFGLFFVKYYEV